jgi:Spx/MgsR family transcriptional regulator
MIRLYGIANCDTVKRARAWLAEQGHDTRFHDFKKLGVPVDRLDRWIERAGWEALLNRRGSTWRNLDEVTRAAMVDAVSARALMLAQPSAIKRPVIEWGDGAAAPLTIGFAAGFKAPAVHASPRMGA